MISSYLCSQCRLCFINNPGLKHISQRLLLNYSQALCTRNYCNNLEDKQNDSVSINHTSHAFNEIYRFPGVRWGYYLHKLKWYQSVLAGVSVPSSLVLYFYGLIDSSWAVGVIIPAVSLTLNLYAVSAMYDHAVGFLYLSEDETTVKISFLDFWGNRIDREFPVDDVVPFLDAPRPPTDFIYKQLVFYSSEKTKLKLCLRFGRITNKDKFDKVFGPLD